MTRCQVAQGNQNKMAKLPRTSLTVERALPFKFMETLFGKGHLVKAIVTVFFYINSEPPV